MCACRHCVARDPCLDPMPRQYVEHIHSLLADGGIWINLGPLLYHYSDSPDVDSTELSYSELRLLVLHYGFEIKEEVLPPVLPPC